MTKSDLFANKYPSTNTRFEGMDTTIFGTPASQIWCDLMLWEHMFNAEKPAHVIELGTGRGGLSMFLHLQCVARGAKFVTLDSHNWTPLAGPLFAHLSVRYFQGDTWESGPKLISEAIAQGGKVCVFCDNGDKPREFRAFAQMLRNGDIIAAHDWGYEIKPEDIEGLPVVMFEREACEANNSVTRWFKVVRND